MRWGRINNSLSGFTFYAFHKEEIVKTPNILPALLSGNSEKGIFWASLSLAVRQIKRAGSMYQRALANSTSYTNHEFGGIFSPAPSHPYL